MTSVRLLLTLLSGQAAATVLILLLGILLRQLLRLLYDYILGFRVLGFKMLQQAPLAGISIASKPNSYCTRVDLKQNEDGYEQLDTGVA